MTSFVKGQPFSSGPVWDQMRFGGEQTPGTMPLAGNSYISELIGFASNPALSSLPEDLRGFAVMGGMLNLRDAESARRSEAMFDKALAYQERAAQKANEMGIRNVAIGSFVDAIKGIPAAFSQGQRYTPEQVAFAGRAMELQPRGGTRPNYYGFVG
jgi:hypothetical protein